MVRLEKVLYEQILNVKALGRARTIATPQKWYNENRHEAYKVAAYRVLHTGITGAVYRAFEPFFSVVFWKWARDIAQ